MNLPSFGPKWSAPCLLVACLFAVSGLMLVGHWSSGRVGSIGLLGGIGVLVMAPSAAYGDSLRTWLTKYDSARTPRWARALMWMSGPVVLLGALVIAVV